VHVLLSLPAFLLLTTYLGPVSARAGELYAGTSEPGMVYAYDGTSWRAVSGVLGVAVLDIVAFDGSLYAAAFTGYEGLGQVWRRGRNGTWTVVWTAPGSPSEFEVADLEV
jgi:hypothetical protein